MITKILSAALLILLSSIDLIAQSPVPEKEIMLKTTTGNISGTLLNPVNAETVVVIVAGSGPTDRNGNSKFGLNTNTYSMLAKGLAEKGIASLRYDKRGVGKSASAITREEDLTFDIMVSDVKSWVDFLRKDFRFKKVVLIGHSEGALIASVAAQQPGIDALVTLAGSGRPLDELITAQLKANPANPPFIIDQSQRILDSLKAGKLVTDIPAYFQPLYRPSVQPYLISSLKYSPAEELKKVTVPVLIIQGDADLQVKVQDAELLAAAKPSAKKVIIKGMNHTLKTVTDMADNQKTYSDPNRPLTGELLTLIIDFVKIL